MKQLLIKGEKIQEVDQIDIFNLFDPIYLNNYSPYFFKIIA